MEDRIIIDPAVCNGRPAIRGTRITAQTVLKFLGAGDSIEDVLEEYPTLTRDDVLACLLMSCSSSRPAGSQVQIRAPQSIFVGYQRLKTLYSSRLIAFLARFLSSERSWVHSGALGRTRALFQIFAKLLARKSQPNRRFTLSGRLKFAFKCSGNSRPVDVQNPMRCNWGSANRGFAQTTSTMLVWTTQFPVLPNHTTTDLMMVCRRWLTGSPHFESKGLQIPEIIDGEIATASNGIHSVAIAKIENKGESHCAFRHGWQDDDKRDWMTEICGWHTGNRFFVGIHLHCATSETGTRLPPPKKPYIVRQILEDLGGDLDVDFPVSAEPQPLGEADIEIAARLLSGETDHYLPVIYASSTWQEQPPFDSQKLAQWAAGMAHVVVEPSRRFSFLLADRVGRINPYDGAVSICWPRGGGRATRLFPYHYPDQIRFATAIAETVRHALAGRRPDHRCSWDYVRGLIVREKIEAFRREGKAGIEEYVEKFDEEIQVTQRRLEEAEIEIGRLKAELANRVRGERFYSDGLLVPSSERDLYAGEQRDILVRALTIAHDNSQSGGRVKDVLAALIKANRPTGESKRIEDGIRNAMDGCDDLGKRERRELENLGFSISGEGKHLKLVFRGDDRYTFAMSKTGSDWRGMKNWISDVTKRLFK